MEAWYVAKTKVQKERLVENYLSEKLGVDVFIPYIQNAQKRNTGMEMLFPSYIFCFVDPQSRDWGAIRCAPGVSYFLGYGNELVPVSEDIINHIKSKVSIWNNKQDACQFKAGDRIKVINGVFSGLDVIFHRYIPSRQRCQVLIEVLGQLSKVEIPVENIHKKQPNLSLVYAN